MTTFTKRKLEANILEGAYNGAIDKFFNDVTWSDEYTQPDFDCYELISGKEKCEAFLQVFEHLTDAGKAYWQIVKAICDKIEKM